MKAIQNILDCHIQDLLREIISSDISSDGDSVSSGKLDLVDDELRFLFVKAMNAGEFRFLVWAVHEIASYALSDDDFCTLLSEKESTATTNALNTAV